MEKKGSSFPLVETENNTYIVETSGYKFIK